MQEVYSLIKDISSSTSNVLILGESGTGKELTARAIHKTSPRKEKPFVVINCSAMPEALLESELFGHKKGAFTGAVSDKQGLFEEADGGTVFLDEVGEISLAMQVKLLRVLQDGEFRLVGGEETRHVNFRIISATNKNLLECVREGKFREDLFYRLNVIGIKLPPLRERREDIPLLAYHFLSLQTKKPGSSVSKISVDALEALQSASWAGNVRELENVVERAVVLAQGETIMARDLPPHILGQAFYMGEEPSERDLSHLSYQEAKDQALHHFNRNYLSALLQQTQGNISVAARRAGVDRSNFKKIIKKAGININEFIKISRKDAL